MTYAFYKRNTLNTEQLFRQVLANTAAIAKISGKINMGQHGLGCSTGESIHLPYKGCSGTERNIHIQK